MYQKSSRTALHLHKLARLITQVHKSGMTSLTMTRAISGRWDVFCTKLLHCALHMKHPVCKNFSIWSLVPLRPKYLTIILANFSWSSTHAFRRILAIDHRQKIFFPIRHWKFMKICWLSSSQILEMISSKLYSKQFTCQAPKENWKINYHSQITKALKLKMSQNKRNKNKYNQLKRKYKRSPNWRI